MRTIGIVALIGFRDSPIGVAPGVNLSIERTVRGTVKRRRPVAIVLISLTGVQIERGARCKVGRDREGRTIAVCCRILASARAIVGPNVIGGRRHGMPR